jgi:hypothetical protein
VIAVSSGYFSGLFLSGSIIMDCIDWKYKEKSGPWSLPVNAYMLLEDESFFRLCDFTSYYSRFGCLESLSDPLVFSISFYLLIVSSEILNFSDLKWLTVCVGEDFKSRL